MDLSAMVGTQVPGFGDSEAAGGVTKGLGSAAMESAQEATEEETRDCSARGSRQGFQKAVRTLEADAGRDRKEPYSVRSVPMVG